MLNPCTLAEFSTDFSTMEQCHVFPKLCLSYDELLTALTSQAILCVLTRALKRHGRFSARQNRVSLSIDGTETANIPFEVK